MNRCSFCEWIPILPWPLWPLAGQFSLGQNVVVGSMTLLLAVRGKHCHEKYVWTPVCFTTAPYHGLMWSYRGSFSWGMPRGGRSQLRNSDQLQSMDRSLCPPLLQNPACVFPRTRRLNEAPVGKGTPPVHNSTRRACDLRFGASP